MDHRVLIPFCLVIVIIAGIDINDTLTYAKFNTASDENSQRKEKVLSLFSVVSFKNSACRSQSTLVSGSSSYRNGTCYTSSECISKGGTASGNCASGFGVCCIFLSTSSGSIIRQNCSYIQNPGFPNEYPTTSSVTYTIEKCTSDVCYIRLDFETFTLLGPSVTDESTGGACANDVFKVTTNTGTATTLVPEICGLNTGQHIYFDIGNQPSDSATLTFTFSTTTNIRMWDIKVTQIECSNPGRPPNGCLQYFTTLTGRITTFNFLSTTTSHLANQNQNVCIKRQDGFCCVQYQVCQGVPDAFSINVPSATPGARIDTLCSEDYVEIIGSAGQCSQATTALVGRYCGPFLNPAGALTQLNTLVCDCTSPFQVLFHTNNAKDIGVPSTTVLKSRGVCLDYTQIPCTGA